MPLGGHHYAKVRLAHVRRVPVLVDGERVLLSSAHRVGVDGVPMTILCRACSGDGYLAVDEDTPERDRLTRDSQRCPYCAGRGWVVLVRNLQGKKS